MGAWCVLGFFSWSVVVVSQRQEVLILAMGWRDGMGLVRLWSLRLLAWDWICKEKDVSKRIRGCARDETEEGPCMAPHMTGI